VKILGPPTANIEGVKRQLGTMTAHPRFTGEMLPALWNAAMYYGIDPVGMVAQAWKETGGGHYRGQVLPEFYNTCGLKVRHVGKYPGIDDGDRPLAHAQFASWEVGAHAHAQHLVAYTGDQLARVRVASTIIVDPRWWLVWGKREVSTWPGLSGKWAPSPNYGQEVVALARRLR
jgi:hypothetical protein